MKKLFLSFAAGALLLFSCNDNSKHQVDTTSAAVETGSSVEAPIQPVGKESTYKKELQWTAFKTDKKVPVAGTFLKISLTGVKEDLAIPESLVNARFICDGTTTSTGDTARDGTLTTFFFKRLSNPEISGYFQKFENNTAYIVIQLNGKSVTKEFPYELKGNQIIIKGSVDILNDFNAQKPFTSLHRACYDLHEGKTWTNVDLVIKISK
ncbi:YceI family protein [Apibacter raozihei]|uniref:YceI family protein n=1 Tax=Apibacter TaxID=1778601 RepID=UPI000FE3631D|nr:MULTISPECIES: YceI family protein [Apibacter]